MSGVQQEFPMVQETPMARRFRQFNDDHPWVYHALVNMALDLYKRGHRRWGIAGLFEVLRWREAMADTGGRFKLNNNYRAFYARKIMEAVPVLAGFFHLRESEADE